MVAGKDLIAEIAGIGAETPLVDAIIAAEGATAPGENFEIAPTAERQAVRAFCKGIAGCASSGEGARNEHDRYLKIVISHGFGIAQEGSLP